MPQSTRGVKLPLFKKQFQKLAGASKHPGGELFRYSKNDFKKRDGGCRSVHDGTFADLFMAAKAAVPRKLSKTCVVKETNNEKEEELLAEAFFSDLRLLQNRCKCTEAMCADITATFGKYMGLKESHCYKSAAKKRDKVLQKNAGIECLSINGCVGCDKFVYEPGDKRTQCPFVKKDGTICDHPRFDVDKNPYEVRLLLF